jgi:hypothetical protein
MSGGSFKYAFTKMVQFADELEVRLDNDRYQFTLETRQKLREIETLARYTAALMREAEWLYSLDTTENGFMQRVAKIESEKPT